MRFKTLRKRYPHHHQTRKQKSSAIAYFPGTNEVKGEVEFREASKGVFVKISFSELPKGKHGIHIHKAGDLRGEGCKAVCDHWHKGTHTTHGGHPGTKGKRHTGDLGNIQISNSSKTYFLKGVHLSELYGRAVIVHADEDDLGKGSHEDSKTTGHSGARIGCAIIGRICK
jgi:Cu-Zn family superoxide dismutase